MVPWQNSSQGYPGIDCFTSFQNEEFTQLLWTLGEASWGCVGLGQSFISSPACLPNYSFRQSQQQPKYIYPGSLPHAVRVILVSRAGLTTPRQVH